MTTVHDIAGLQALLDALRADGYDVLGPQVIDGVIAIRPLASVDQLPTGWADDQQPGAYQLEQTGGPERFGYAVGPQSWKPLLHHPHDHMLTMQQQPGDELVVEVAVRPTSRRAFFGVRPCELAAISKQDAVLLEGPVVDRSYSAARRGVMLIVVNCTKPAATCFCPSMGTGPVAAPAGPHDVEITELAGDADGNPSDVRYMINPTSTRGQHLMEAVRREHPGRPVSDADADDMRVAVDSAVSTMTRRLDTVGLHDALLDSYDADHWDAIAQRCLACGNCTAVCPTCFCTDTTDITDLSGGKVERWRDWDTCFSLEFSRLGSDIVRESVSARYRQWLVHKLATWHDQFDESGCVGCGRCITWCPAGIDLTAEVPLLRAESEARP